MGEDACRTLRARPLARKVGPVEKLVIFRHLAVVCELEDPPPRREGDKMNLRDFVRDVPDFPIPGVMFRDISKLLSTPAAFKHAIEKIVENVDLGSFDAVVGIESRGFILGAALAARHHKGFIPMRKAGKLPPPVQSLSYALEYGQATLEIPHGEGRVLIVDDVLATGGTLDAALKLCERAGYQVESMAVLINLKVLNQFRFRGSEVPSVLVYE